MFAAGLPSGDFAVMGGETNMPKVTALKLECQRRGIGLQHRDIECLTPLGGRGPSRGEQSQNFLFSFRRGRARLHTNAMSAPAESSAADMKPARPAKVYGLAK